VLFDLLEALADPAAKPPARPNDLREVEVCAYSGHIPGPACPTTRIALAPGAHVPTEPCPYHVFRDVDAESGLAVTPGCRAGRTWERRSFVVWPPSVRRFLADTHHQLPEPPSWAPGCEPSGAAEPPRIVSPADNQIAVLIPGLPADEQELPFVADVDRPGAKLTWFVDGEAVGTAVKDERVWWIPRLGRHELVVVDDAGGLARRWLEVRDRP
jgi:penicillin-binding protein 1C